MFDQIKDIYKLKKQADDIRNELSGEQVIGKSRDGRFSVTMNGNQEVLDVYVPKSELVKEEVEEGIKQAFHDARTQVDNLLRSKMGNMFQDQAQLK